MCNNNSMVMGSKENIKIVNSLVNKDKSKEKNEFFGALLIIFAFIHFFTILFSLLHAIAVGNEILFISVFILFCSSSIIIISFIALGGRVKK